MEGEKALASCVAVKFEANHILTQEMLTESYVYPRQWAEYAYARVDNCILCGLEFVERGDEMYLTPGVLKTNGKIYFLKEEISLSHLWQERSDKMGRNLLKFAFVPAHEEQGRKGVSYSTLELCLKTEDEKICLEMGQQQAVNSAVALPQELKEFTHPAEFNVVGVPYYCCDEITFHPCVFAAIKKALEEKPQKTAVDYYLLMLLQSQKVVTKGTLRSYIAAKSVKAGATTCEDKKLSDRQLIEKVREAIAKNETWMIAPRSQQAADGTEEKESTGSLLLQD